MEKAQCDLDDLIRNNRESKESFSEKEIIKVLYQCLDGLRHLLKSNISHRDLKPNNILIKDKQNLEIMLSDFGAAK